MTTPEPCPICTAHPCACFDPPGSTPTQDEARARLLALATQAGPLTASVLAVGEHEDPEIEAMLVCVNALWSLDQSARTRVLEYLTSRDRAQRGGDE
jgi:hypothetical protein